MQEQLLKEITFTTSRSSGPGGQHVNKTESRVTLNWNLESSAAFNDDARNLVRRGLKTRLTAEGDLKLSCQSYRSQNRNKEEVTERFLALIEKLARPPKKRKKTKPTKASIERRLKEKKVRSAKKSNRGKPKDDQS